MLPDESKSKKQEKKKKLKYHLLKGDTFYSLLCLSIQDTSLLYRVGIFLVKDEPLKAIGFHH